MVQQPFCSVDLPQPDDLDDALGLVAGDLQMLLEGVGGGVPVALQGRLENFQMQVCSRLIMLTLPVMMRNRVFRPVMRS